MQTARAIPGFQHNSTSIKTNGRATAARANSPGVVGFRWGLLWGWWWREVRNPLQGRHWRQRRRVRDMIYKNVINSNDFDTRDEEERLEGLTLLTSMTFRGDSCSIRSHPRISAWVSTRSTLVSIHGEPSVKNAICHHARCHLTTEPSCVNMVSWR